MTLASFHLLLLSLLISSCHCAGLPEINEPVCVQEAGSPNWRHCNDIITNQLPPRRPGRTESYSFRQARQGSVSSLPAYFRKKNCLIIVNTLGGGPIINGPWVELRTQATRLVHSCVMPGNGAGGHLRMANGLFLAVWEPSFYIELARRSGFPVPQCVRNVRAVGLGRQDHGVTRMLRERDEGSGTDEHSCGVDAEVES